MSNNSGVMEQPGSSDMVSSRLFLLALGAAFLLHLAGMYAWSLMPKVQVIDIPVHALNIKLGDGDVAPEEVKPAVTNNTDVENTVSRLVRDSTPKNESRAKEVTLTMEKAMTTMSKSAAPNALDKVLDKMPVGRGKGFDIRAEGTAAAAPVVAVTAKQYVRENAPEDAKAGDAGASSEEIVTRYKQLVSIWIQKFQLYPDDAKAKGMQCETVVRVRIDRHGNVQYYALEHSTGQQVLDRAAIDMIRRANPVPAVPDNYPADDLLEFLIPVNFHK
jgi:TonB family protein